MAALDGSETIVFGSGYVAPAPVRVAPGQVATFFLSGFAQDLQGSVQADRLPLPEKLAGISAELKQGTPAFAVPIFAVSAQSTCTGSAENCSPYVAVSVQIPFGINASSPEGPGGALVPFTWITFLDEVTGRSASLELAPYVDQIHVLRGCDLFLRRDSVCRPVATHADGTPIAEIRPAFPGEEIQVYAFGLGVTSPPILTGHAPSEPATVSSIRVSFDARPNAGPSKPGFLGSDSVRPSFAGLVPGFVGLYQINVIIPDLPSTAPRCGQGAEIDSNLTINFGGQTSFDGAQVCVQPIRPG